MLTKNDINTLDDLMAKRLSEELAAGLEKGLSPIKEDLKSLKKDMNKVKKDLKTTINFFDKDIVDLKKRTKRIEIHLDLPIHAAI